jgi:hypothetical protein
MDVGIADSNRAASIAASLIALARASTSSGSSEAT